MCQLALSKSRLRYPRLQHACSAVLSFRCASPVQLLSCTGEVHDLQLDLGPAGKVDLSLQFEPLSEDLLDGLAGRVRRDYQSVCTHANAVHCVPACLQLMCIFEQHVGNRNAEATQLLCGSDVEAGL